MKRCFLLLSVLSALLLGCDARVQAQAQTQATRPNVLFIVVDDLKPLLGCYGDKSVKSPNIDRLAKRGVRFDMAFANQAVCAPSRNAMMTSLRPQSIGIYDLGTNFRKAVPDAVTLPQSFMKAGYRAESIGKIMHRGHGNDEDAASWSVPHTSPGGNYVLPKNTIEQQKRVAEAKARGASQSEISNLSKGAPTEMADVPDNAYGDGKIADEAIKRLQAAKQRKGTPFFLAVGFYKPHLPFTAPKKYWDLYDPKQFPLAEIQTPPEDAPDFAPQFGGELRQYEGVPDKGRLPDEMQRHLIHGYYAAVSFMDAQLGRVLDELDANGFSDNTIIVLWGDHGWHLGDHGQWCKHTNYEQAARIPLIVCAPGLQRDVSTMALTETVDIYPTLCELANVPMPKGLEGVSFAKTLKDPKFVARDSIIHVYPRRDMIGRAIRNVRYRMVEWKKPGAPIDTAVYELYDYQTDPLETKNLAALQPAVMAQMKAILAKHPEAKPQIRATYNSAPKNTNTAKPPQDREAMFTKRDKNGDGKLTLEEFLIGQPDPNEAPKRFPLFDANKDGVLSKEEFVSAGRGKPGK